MYADGAAATGTFPLSDSESLSPGKKIEILAGASNDPQPIFNGVVIKHRLKVRDNNTPQLIIECRHEALKMTVGRKSAYYFEKKDSEIMTDLIEQNDIPIDDIEATDATHKEQVQYAATDWDFMRMRAAANGKLIYTNDEKMSIKKPDFEQEPVASLAFGATLLELDIEVDAREQYSGVKTTSWDPAEQDLMEKEAVPSDADGPGNYDSESLSEVAGGNDYELKASKIEEEEAQAWADATRLRAALGKVKGRLKTEGIATINPGEMVNLDGVGERYQGKVFVTGVRHDYDLMEGWKTHIQFGQPEEAPANSLNDVSVPKAANLLPAINGLQIGIVVSNEDPDGEHRVRVRMPLVDNEDEGTWARVSSLDAGEERGFFFRPEIDDEVILGFLDDDPRQAIILGMLHSSAKPAPLEGSDDNHEKVFQSRSGMKLYFDDDKKKMELETPEGNKISLDEDEQALTISDQNGNKIEMTSDGIKIDSSAEIIFQAATDIKIESSTSLTIKAGTELKMEGGAGAELSSSAVTTVKGSLLQLN